MLSEALPPRKRSVRLKTAFDVQRFLAKLVNGVYRDEIEPGKSTKIGYLLGVMLRSQELGDIEARLTALEQNKDWAK